MQNLNPVDLPECNDEELDPLVLDNLKVDCAGEVAHINPAGSPLDVVVNPGDKCQNVIVKLKMLLNAIKLYIQYIVFNSFPILLSPISQQFKAINIYS